jgi:16S rRNA C967 or C1407 C5-methylase (RsmB/RsmF family)
MEGLNCYLCACPNFRFDDEGLYKEGEKVTYSTCSIASEDGAQFVSENAIHQDCSGCTVPHHESYIRKNFNRDWFEVMRRVR